MTLGVLSPAVIFSLLGDVRIGVSMSLGAFLVSIADSTGPIAHRRTGMLSACFFVFFSALVTGLTNVSPYFLAIQIPIFCFVFAMFSVYGARAASVGAGALLAMAISMDPLKTQAAFWLYALLVLMGGLWYTVLSLTLMEIRPYRVAQQALGECVLKLADFISQKADFYKEGINVEDNFRRLASTQILVHEHQDTVREMLYKTRIKVGESIKSGQLLLVIFVDTVDIFEQVMSTHYDYGQLKERFGKYPLLKEFGWAIQDLADKLRRLGYALINNEKPGKFPPSEDQMDKLKGGIEELERQGIKCLMLRKIFANISAISSRVENIYNYFYEEKLTFISETRENSLTKFVSRQEFSWKIMQDNLSLDSSVFRHGIRLAVTCLLGFFVSMQMSLGSHSYWVILTILVILRPGYSLTKKRNTQRMLGTVAGGVTGVLILYFVPDFTIRFIFLILFMILAYSFLRTRYFLAVLFMTPFIFIVYALLYPESDFMIVQERILDTFVGSGLAYLASIYFLPSWEYGGFRQREIAAVQGSLAYFSQLVSRFDTEPFDELAYRLARKRMYLKSANLAASFQRMLDEPAKQQKNKEALHQFVVLNHILNSYFSTLSASLSREDVVLSAHEQIVAIKRSRNYLLRALEHLGDDSGEAFDFSILENEATLLKSAQDAEVNLLTEQLQLIQKTCSDIEKLCRKLGVQNGQMANN
ncbi:membrane protein [Echinicola pacifica]|uniref:Membrane protein n=2 Tax=Echinicola pacifica TaxID=346377 RepID=A0A918PZZ6_9BACT|nr:membrane protein [Echinicola pacifica]